MAKPTSRFAAIEECHCVRFAITGDISQKLPRRGAPCRFPQDTKKRRAGRRRNPPVSSCCKTRRRRLYAITGDVGDQLRRRARAMPRRPQGMGRTQNPSKARPEAAAVAEECDGICPPSPVASATRYRVARAIAPRRRRQAVEGSTPRCRPAPWLPTDRRWSRRRRSDRRDHRR